MNRILEAIEIDQEAIKALMEEARPEADKVGAILERAAADRRVGLRDAAILLKIEEPLLLSKLYETAQSVKEQVFGDRIVLFAPLYISNRCVNSCLYCGFRAENRAARRKVLSIAEIVREANWLYQRGYRRVLLVAGEKTGDDALSFLCKAVEAIYRETSIRIVHVNAAPMTVEQFQRIKAAGAGVYQCFQETYHRPTYALMHPAGPKRNYAWRLSVMERAMEGGFGDVGMGALFGLYDYRFEVLALIAHARSLEDRFGVGPHTVSVPRLRPAAGAVLDHIPYPVSDETFKKIVAVFRLSIPYAGVVVSTRESAALRQEVIRIGASQISAGSRTDVGGYADGEASSTLSQFSLNDTRDLDEVIGSLLDDGLLPSLCTACYRSGRTGETFRAAAEAGRIKNFCDANALFSLMEYLEHNASPKTRAAGLRQIGKRTAVLEDGSLRIEVEEQLARITAGEEDVHL